MGVISAGDQTLLRERKDAQFSTEKLYGFGFPVIWKGRVDDISIARGDQTVAYDTGALEAGFVFANIVTDMLVFVGSAEGLDDKGRRRILSIGGVEASGTFIFDWNDDVDWADNDYLTVVHFFPPWPRYSWFTSTGPIFAKDGPNAAAGGAGEIYSDQNEEPPPLVIMGPHFAGELSAGTLAVQLSAANSQAVADGAAISSFAWAAVPTASVSFDNAAIAAPVVTFVADNTKYWIACTVTDDNGKSSTGYRSYQIGGAITEFSRSPITENYDNPSVNATITLTSPETTDSAAIRPVMTWADFADRTLVVITSEDQYGLTQKAISFRDAAQYTDHLHILYVGYLWAENDDLVDDGSGTVTLNAVSTIPMFLYSVSLTGVETPTDWYEMDKTLMTVAANLFHLFKYQSTLLEIMDWHLPFGDTIKRSANEEFNEGSLVDRARALAGSRLMAITAVGLGEVWVENDLNLRNSTDRTAEATTLTMTNSDVSGTKRARVRQYGDNIRALLDGGSSTGLLGSFTPFLSASQFIARSEGRPQMVNFGRLMLPDQTEANRLAGRIATVANGKYQEVNLELSGNYRGVFSPGDQQKVDLGDTFAATLQANIRGYTDLEDADVIVRVMTHTHSQGFTSVSIVADIMQDEGLTGVTITPPAVPPDAIEPGSGDTPSFEPPPPPVYPPVPPNLAVPGAAVGVDEDDGVYWTLDSGSTWEARNDGLATAGGSDLIWDPWWFTAFGNNSSNPEDVILWWTGTGFIRRSIDAGKNWSDFTQYLTTPPNVAADSPAPTVSDLDYHQIHGDIHDFGRFVVIGTWTAGGGEVRSWIWETNDNGFTGTWTELAVAAPVGTNPNTLTWILDADPDQEIYNDNDAVTTITNQGTGANGTGGVDPTFKTNIQNGKSIYRFDSASSEWKSFGTGFGKPANFTLFIVSSMDTTTSMTPIGSASNPIVTGKSWGILTFNVAGQGGNNSFVSTHSDDTNDTRKFTGQLINTSTFYVIGIRYTSGDAGVEAWINSGQVSLTTSASGATTNAGAANTYAMGRAGAAAASFFDGDIGRSLLVNSALTDAQMENLSDWLLNYYFPSTELQVLAEDIDLENGQTLYLTVWNGLTLILQNRQSGSFATVNKSKSFGTASAAQITARTFWIGCYCPGFFGTASLDDIVYVYGRLDDGTVRHVLKSTDGGTSFTDIGDSATWLTGWVGGFFADDANTLYAFVNGASRALYRSLNGGTSWTNLSTLPFDVDYESVSKHSDGRILIANRAAGAQMVAYAVSPDYSSWTNATGSPSFPTAGGGARSIVWVT